MFVFCYYLRMPNLNDYWNKSSATIPKDKDPSNYSIKIEPLFPRNAVVCDLGCGTGIDSLYFAEKGHTVKLIDISDFALKQAENLAARRGIENVETYQCNFEAGQIPQGDNSCDVVYSRLALHYFKFNILSKLLGEIYRILKPTGKAYLTLKSPKDVIEMEYLVGNATEIEEGVFDEGGYIKTRFSIDQLQRALCHSGIPAGETSVVALVEKLDGRNDKVKSGKAELLVNEINITKSM